MNGADRENLEIQSLPGYDPEIGRWLWAMEDTRRRTKEAIGDLSQEVLGWVPPEGGNSIGTLLYHVAAIEIDWLHADILEGQPFPAGIIDLFPYDVRDGAGSLSPVTEESLQEHLHRLDRVRDHFLEVLRGVSLDEYRRLRCLEAYDVTPEWVIHHLMQHEAEHRGQIGEIRVRAES